MVKAQDEIKKVGKSIHPKSRKAKQLSRQVTRDAKMAKKKAFTNMRLQLLGEKLHWFKNNIEDSLKVYSDQQMLDFIKRYIERHSEEMELINFKQNIGNRKSRQHASREDLIRINKENELAEFNGSGLETVDLTDSENLKNFRLWNGELRYITNIKVSKFRSINCGGSSSVDSSINLKMTE